MNSNLSAKKHSPTLHNLGQICSICRYKSRKWNKAITRDYNKLKLLPMSPTVKVIIMLSIIPKIFAHHPKVLGVLGF